ncbi:SUMF1/EgtB/PvdO family nonheme iron enzyme [Methylomonas sp. MED-D]|uniref:formylglycine-generating enzyme family protein n=1 Tax=Methylomonas sp. MED-D TaxID=3418768 RepID=UPI003CFE0082
MSKLPPRSGALSRADLLVALAELEGAAPDATALTIADALGLEWQPPKIKSRKATTKKTKQETSSETQTPAIHQAPLLDSRYWRVEQAEFFGEAEPYQPPPPTLFKGWRNPPPAPADFQPLSTWAELAPRLRKVLSQYREGRGIDLNLTVHRISRGQLLERFPREHRRRWGPALLLIEDDSQRLTPFREDKRRVRWAIQSLLPRYALYRALMDDHRDCPELLGQAATDWPPPPGTLVLALSDLGCLAAGSESVNAFNSARSLSGAEANPTAAHPLCQRWLEIGRVLQEAGCHPLALFPAPLSRCPPELAAVWQLVAWERPRANDGLPLAQRAERLLRLMSPASRVTPALLRAVRLLLPDEQADAGTEADVWQHPDFNSQLLVPALLPERAQSLRRELAEQPGEAARQLRARLIRCLKPFRHGLPQEIWFDELLNFDEQALDDELRQDRADAQDYFANFCDEISDLDQPAMPAGDRAWLLRIKNRSAETLWRDPKVGKRLAQLALAVDPDGAPPRGIGARDLPSNQPERNLYLSQRGGRLLVDEDAAPAQTQGSVLAMVPSRNGLLEIALEPGDADANAFWESGQPPAWANAWGWDDYGAWVEFSVANEFLPDQPRVSQKLRWIPPGRFLMGSPPDEAERSDDEGPQHLVTFKEGFWLFDTACTDWLWMAVMNNNPNVFGHAGKYSPVENVSWLDAQAFIQALNQLLPGLHLCLPSEAQWEYACRAGTTTPFAFGDNITPDQVNYDGNSPYADGAKGEYRGKTVPVASLPANRWGLYEMHGNVLEWTQDAWHAGYDGAPGDGRAREVGEADRPRVVRGGSWDDGAGSCRCACRGRIDPDVSGDGLGFRCARVQTGERGAHEAERVRPAERNRLGPIRFEARSRGEPAVADAALAATADSSRVVRPSSDATASLMLPKARGFTLITDCGSLTVQPIIKPDWATAMGRDRFGLWAEFAIQPAQGQPVVQRLRWIPPGRFMMGSPDHEPGRWDDEGPQHWVTISQGYWLFDTPCTQLLWQAVMGDNPSYFKSSERPVEQVSCDDVQTFLGRINELLPGLALSLPSEAQWEYACRAGTDTALYSGPIDFIGKNNAPALDTIAWYGGNSGEQFDLEDGFDTSDWEEMQYPHAKAGSHPVRGKLANPWGLYDMLGNVLEWTQDAWHAGYEGAPGDGRAWEDDEAGGPRVVRGGSWLNVARYCRCAYRNLYDPVERRSYMGFRCARVQE